jgi:hypothetical protein
VLKHVQKATLVILKNVSANRVILTARNVLALILMIAKDVKLLCLLIQITQ